MTTRTRVYSIKQGPPPSPLHHSRECPDQESRSARGSDEISLIGGVMEAGGVLVTPPFFGRAVTQQRPVTIKYSRNHHVGISGEPPVIRHKFAALCPLPLVLLDSFAPSCRSSPVIKRLCAKRGPSRPKAPLCVDRGLEQRVAKRHPKSKHENVKPLEILLSRTLVVIHTTIPHSLGASRQEKHARCSTPGLDYIP